MGALTHSKLLTYKNLQNELKLSEVKKCYLLFLHGFKPVHLTEQFQVEGFGNKNMGVLKTKLTENKRAQK